MKDNELYFSSINVAYDFYKFKFVKAIGMERLRLSFYANDIARFNSTKIERGTSYPFARNYTISLMATF